MINGALILEISYFASQTTQSVKETIAAQVGKARFEADQANKEREKRLFIEKGMEKVLQANMGKWALEDERQEAELAYKADKLKIERAMVAAQYSRKWDEYRRLESELSELEERWSKYESDWIKRRLKLTA